MDQFRRKLIGLLVTTCLLLFIAWVGLKLMQYRGDWQRMLADGQRWLRDWGKRLSDFVRSARAFLEPLWEKITQFFRNLTGQSSGA